MNPYVWDGYDRPGVVVYPRLGGAAATRESWQDYFDQLSAAICVVGLNTTAFLEAVVAGRPCLTITGEKFYSAHEQTGHFRHLLDADFLEIAHSATDVAERVARIREGVDEKAEGRRQFAEWFLRPRGLESAVAPGLADTVEELARVPGLTAAPVDRPRREKDAHTRVWSESRAKKSWPSRRPATTLAASRI